MTYEISDKGRYFDAVPGRENRFRQRGSAEQEIGALCAADPAEKLVLDMEGLQYISSAGLRVILKLCRQYPSLEITDVSREIYEVLEMSGLRI